MIGSSLASDLPAAAMRWAPRRFSALRAVGVAMLGAALFPLLTARADPDRSAWMRPARWGVMSHFLADWRAQVDGGPMSVARWNNLVDHFDVETLADQLKSVGAGYYLFTIGQNSGYFLSPNAVYDRLVGIAPSRCSRRDLVNDLADALHRRGLRLMVYLPSGAPGGDAVARRALDFHSGPDRNREFQRNWEQIIAEWSRRWGPKVSGWWFDGCYWPNTMYRQPEAPNFASFAAAARAGNPDAVVAFNPGVVYRTISLTPDEDYTAGETNDLELWSPKRIVGGKIDGAQVHVLSYLGATWGKGTPRFTAAQAAGYSRRIAAAGGVVTWDTPLQPGGTFAPALLDQLAAIGRALAAVPAP